MKKIIFLPIILFLLILLYMNACVFFLLWGIILSIGSFSLFIYNKFIFAKKAMSLKGKIICFRPGSCGTGGTTYYPIIEYIDPNDNNKYEYESNIGRPTKKLLGKEIEILVYVDRNGKRSCLENTILNLYILPSILIVIGIVTTIICSSILFK